MKAGMQMHNYVQKGQKKMTRYILALTLAMVVLCETTKNVSAQEILLEGPLAGAPAVRKKVQYRKLRFSVGPQFGYTILSDYMHSFMPGLKLEFNITDWFAIGAVGFYAINAPTHLTKHISNSENLAGNSTVPADSNWPSYTGSAHFEDQVARLNAMIIGQLAFIPLRGKLAAFEKLFVAVDGFLFIGGGAVIFEERSPCAGASCGNLDDFQYRPGSVSVQRTRITKGVVSFGLGFTSYFNDFIGLNLEYRITPFKWNAAGTDEAGQSGTQWVLEQNPQDRPDDIIWRSSATGSGDYPDGIINDKDRVWNANQVITIGVVFNLPTKPRITD
jgi:outer membrane beta-barrel protein